MGRASQSVQIESVNEEAALAFFRERLGSLPDPRRAQGVRYPLESVVMIALMAMVSGCDDAESMQGWGEVHQEWLSGIVELPHGVPSQDVYLAVFGALDGKAFSKVFTAWAELLTHKLRASAQGAEHIAIDGKTSRRSHDMGKGKPALHTVSAWLSGAGLVLGQVKTHEKSNEITAIPELLRTLNLKGATVTIDAMGCQTEIAEVIVEKEGHYVLSVKDNQPTLRQEIATTFAETNSEGRRFDDSPALAVQTWTQVDKGHGRLEERTVAICHDLRHILTADRWQGLAFVAKVERTRTVLSTQKTSSETAYYIGSNGCASAEQVAGWIRSHWSIEVGLHWVLDLAFAEDTLRHRSKNTAQNMATLRHFALNIVKSCKTRKLGVANTRRQAGFSRAFMVDLLIGGSAA